jgi:YebC/PmpR family DNA-binding regulatory protein
MSGHSHFKTVMHKKGAADAKRSQVFSKLAKELTVAAKEGGADPNANPRLRTVIDKARDANMPADNIERAIKKATGEGAGQLEEMLIEAYGPGNIALLISAITDNRNRTLGEIKQILQKNHGKMVEGGAVRWLFEKKGVAAVNFAEIPSKDKDTLELQLIEAGAQDIRWSGQILEAYAEPSDLSSLIEKLTAQGITAQTSLGWIPKERAVLPTADTEAAQRLFEVLDDHDDVQGIYANL